MSLSQTLDLVLDKFHERASVSAVLILADAMTTGLRAGSSLAMLALGALPDPPYVILQAFMRAFHGATLFL